MGITEWADEVIDEPALVRRGLREAGWDTKSIHAFAAQYAAVQHEQMPRRTRVDRIRDLLGMRRRVVEKTWTEVVEVPRYRFGAPPVRGAKVEYSEGDTVAHGSGWALKFFGVGVGATASLEVSRSRTFVATDGRWKQVFVPVMVRVSRVAQNDGEELVGRGHEAQVVAPSESGDPLLQRRGIRVAAGSGLVLGEASLDHYDTLDLALGSDKSGEVHKEKRTWVTDVGRELSIPLGKMVDVSALVRVKRTRRLELAFELPSGYDYRAYLCNGFTHWDSPRGTMEKRSRRPSSGGTAA